MRTGTLLGVGLVTGGLLLAVLPWRSQASEPRAVKAEVMKKPDGAHLTAEQRRVLMEGGTERAFSGKYWDEKKPGDYHCAACGNLLFHSDAKFDSGTGWPSYWEPATPTSVVMKEDRSIPGMPRTEVVCGKCGGHLGHVFNDSPETPTGNRFCINSAAMELNAKEGGKGEKDAGTKTFDVELVKEASTP